MAYTMVYLDSLSHSIISSPPVTSSIVARPRPVQQPSRLTFAVLPEELVVKVLESCDFKAVLACQQTCRALRNVVVGSTSLRYKLALSEHGMCDGTTSDLNIAEKLELLTAHADAWQSLDSAFPEKADLLMGWSPPIAVSCNVMVFSRNGKQPENQSRNWDNDTEAALEPRSDLLVLRVPSTLRRVGAAHWVLNLPAEVNEVCIDVSQDLLIYIWNCTFYTCTLSTGAVHPLAEHEGSFCMWNLSRIDDAFIPCVYGDFVAVATVVYFISVWNWKTGQLVSEQLSDVHFSSFDFLDEHHILYADSNEDSICVYDLRGDQQQQPRKENENENERDMGLLRFRLVLPPINRATTSRYIQVRRNALPTATGSSPHPSPLSDGRSLLSNGDNAPSPASAPFHADPHERLIVARVVTSPVERGEEQFELHIPARAFLDHFSAATTVRNQDGGGYKDEEDGVVAVPWTAWRTAVRATPPRKVPYVVQARKVVYGTRAVSHPPDWDEGVLYVDSYLPRSRGREEAREAEAEVGAGVRGMRQAIRLPPEVEDKEGFLSVLCEDAILCYKTDPLSGKISHAYWYTF